MGIVARVVNYNILKNQILVKYLGRISVSGHPPQSLNFPREGFRGAQADGGRVLFLEAAERNFDKARDSATSFSQRALNRA